MLYSVVDDSDNEGHESCEEQNLVHGVLECVEDKGEEGFDHSLALDV